MPFYTRPNFEDRQLVQYSGDTITLSGDTNIHQLGKFRIYKDAAPGLVATSLDFDGTVVWGPVSGLSWSISACTSPFYVNNIVACPTTGGTIQVDAGNLALNSQLNFLIGLSAGTTSDNVLVIGGDGYIRSVSQASITPIFTGGTGTCITDLYVTNIHGCSPLNIQPTSPDDVIIAKGGGNVGIDVSPSYKFHVSGRTSNTELWYDDFDPIPSFNLVSNKGDQLSFLQIYDTDSSSTIALTFRGFNESSFPSYGKQGDATLSASVNVNGLNIVNNNGTNKEDYIRFYAGGNPGNKSSDMHIQGTGSTTGFIGMGTEDPQAKLDVSGKTRTTTLQVTSGATIGYVLTAIDSNGNASWQPSSVGTFTGNTSGDCITDLYVRNLHGCSPIYVHDILSGNSTNNFLDLSSSSNNLLLQTTAFSSEKYLGMGQAYSGVRLQSSPSVYMSMSTSSAQVFSSDLVSLIPGSKNLTLQNDFGLDLFVQSPVGSSNGSLFIVRSNSSAGGNSAGHLTGGTLQGEIVFGKPLYPSSSSGNLGLPTGVMGTGLGSETTTYGVPGYDYFPVFISTPRSRAYDDVDYSSIKNVLFGGGSNNIVYTGVTNSALIGGSGNTINSYLKNTVVLAGEAITATTSNTVYVPDLVIKKSASVPTTSGDTVGDIGSVTWDNTYLYVKTNNGWGRTLLDYGF